MGMMTVKQVSSLTGISVRTLQFYDEIGLFKPTDVTQAGYRLYAESALEELQQILFFKELDFTLKEIKAIMGNPQFDQAAAFQKQRTLIQMKRDRLSALLELLDKLIKGDKCMDFKDFDMSAYFSALSDFKRTHTDGILKQLGSVERFDEMIADLKSREDEIAEMAVRQYGSLDAYTKAMQKSLESFLTQGPAIAESEVSGLIQKTEELTKRLTADLTRDAASEEVQQIVREWISFTEACNRGTDMGENYWACTAEAYGSKPEWIEVNDRKYGEGASRFISSAIRAYLEQKTPS